MLVENLRVAISGSHRSSKRYFVLERFFFVRDFITYIEFMLIFSVFEN